MRFRWTGLGLMLGMVAAEPLLAQSMTTNEARSLPPGALARQVLGGEASTIVETDIPSDNPSFPMLSPPRRGGKIYLTHVTFFTQPESLRATGDGWWGLCANTRLDSFLDDTGKVKTIQRARQYGALMRLERVPSASSAGIAGEWERRCHSITAASRLFGAESDIAAVRGATAVQMIADDLKRGPKLPYPTTCKGGSRTGIYEPPKPCTRPDPSLIDVAAINSVQAEPCRKEAEDRNVSRLGEIVCLNIRMNDFGALRRASGAMPMSNDTVRVRLEQRGNSLVIHSVSFSLREHYVI